MNSGIHVAITGMNAADSPAPGVPVARCIKEHPLWRGRIIGLAYDAFESGILDRRIADAAYLLPYPSAGKAALLERLASIHARERIDVVIPNLDSEMANFISIENELKQLGISVFLPTASQFEARLKTSLPRFSEETGIPSPKTWRVHSEEDPVLRDLDFPVMVKGIFYEAFLAHTREQVLESMRAVAARWGYPVLVQEYIDGDEYNGVALGDGQGGMIGSAFMRKLVLTDKRKGWTCVSIENAELLELTRSILRALKWRGPIEVEAIYSRKEGRFSIIELNPRFPAWVYLAKAAGANLPYACLQLALGQSPGALEHRSGVVFTNYTVNLVAELTQLSSLFTQGELHYVDHEVL